MSDIFESFGSSWADRIMERAANVSNLQNEKGVPLISVSDLLTAIKEENGAQPEKENSHA